MLFEGPNKEKMKRYGKNPIYKGWLLKNVTDVNNSTQVYTCTWKPMTVYAARYAAVSGFIFAIVDGKYSVLANLRGKGVPDFQGYWNVPCGYLEKYENSKEGIAREILEECGFQIDLDDLQMIDVETNPEECNKGNVTIRHKAFLGKIIPQYITKYIGEKDEVDDVRWIPIYEIDNYKWAFNHRKMIKQYRPKRWKCRLIEWYYKWFKKI